MRVYKTGFTAEEITANGPQGFSALKLQIGLAAGEDMGDVVEQFQRVRQVLAPEIQLMGDAGMKLDVGSTLQLAERLEAFDLLWLEEPLPPDDLEGYARLRDQCRIPIAGGEHEYTAEAFKIIVHEKLHAVAQPDVCWCGGMTELLKIYRLAQGTDVVVCPHRGAEAWSLHAIAALSTEPLAESGRPWMTWVQGSPEITRGQVKLSENPGFGVWFEKRELEGADANL